MSKHLRYSFGFMIIMFLGVSCGTASKVRGPVALEEIKVPDYYRVIGIGQTMDEAIENCYYYCQDTYLVTADTVVDISHRVERLETGVQIIVNGTAVRFQDEKNPYIYINKKHYAKRIDGNG